MDAYQKTEQTFSSISLKEISGWILEHIN